MADETDDIRCIKCGRIDGPCKDTDCPEAEALPTLPVVAWQYLSDHEGWKDVCEERRDVLKRAGYQIRGLTPQAPAEAAIVALRAEVAELRKERDELNDARNAAIERANFMHGATREAQEFAAAAQEDTRRLNRISERRLTLEEWMGRGGVIGWRVTTFNGNESMRVELAFGETPRQALDAARASLLGDGGTL